MIPNKHLVAVKYLGYTNTKPSRVKLTSHRFTDGRDAVIIPYDHAHNQTSGMAVDWLTAHGFTIFCVAETIAGYAVLVNEFVPLNEAKRDATACNKWRARQ